MYRDDCVHVGGVATTHRDRDGYAAFAARGLEDGAPIRIFNDRGEFRARAHVTDRIPSGTVWMRDGWTGLNRLTSGGPSIPDEAVDTFDFSAGQAAFDATVEVERAV